MKKPSLSNQDPSYQSSLRANRVRPSKTRQQLSIKLLRRQGTQHLSVKPTFRQGTPK